MLKKTTALILSCILIISCFADCGSDKDVADASNGNSNVEAALLRIANDSDIQMMDLTQTTDLYFVTMNVFDRLFEVRIEADGNTKIIGSLCENYSLADKPFIFALWATRRMCLNLKGRWQK